MKITVIIQQIWFYQFAISLLKSKLRLNVKLIINEVK